MAWNPANSPASIMDTISGNISEWYEAVDNVLKKSEVIPGNYEYTVNTSYTSDGAFQEGGQTHVDIVAPPFHIVSVDNSYIDITQTFNITVPVQTTATINTTYYYVGFKSAFDIIDQFRVYSNSDLIQTQNHNNFESFVQYIAASDEAKKNSELFATFDKVQAMQSDVPGVYLNLKLCPANTVISVPIRLRIPLSSFLLLANLKWFPGFWGKMTLEIYPSYKNLVVCPIYKTAALADMTGLDALVAATEVVNTVATPLYRRIGANICGFHQINEPIALTTAADATTAAVTTLTLGQTFTCSNSTCDKCHIRLAQYTVKMDVYTELLNNYVSVPMLFPIQQVINKDFSGKLGTDTSLTTVTQSASLNHCNSVFVVFPKTTNSRTVFENPEMTYQLNIDGKFFPREAYATHNDVRNMNLFLDATNFNGDSMFSIPDDVYHSVQPYRMLYTSSATGVLTASTVYSALLDRSNFAVAIPFTNDDTFQGGIDTAGTVQVELYATKSTSDSFFSSISPRAIYIEDCICKFRAVKPPQEPQISITRATVEQIFAGH